MRANPLRRVVTGHDAAGRAVLTHDTLLTPNGGPSGVAEFTLVWTTPTMPVDNDDATDGRDRQVGLSMPGGTVLRVVDMLPGQRSSMHRTSTLDYGIVMSGVIDLELDDGVLTRLEPGSVIVQRGTVHAWINPSPDTVARVAFVLVDAKPATVGGEPLPPIMPGVSQPKAR